MRFMLIVKSAGSSAEAGHHSQEHIDALTAYKNSLARAGALLAAERLQQDSGSIRICYLPDGGEPEIQTWPFRNDQELFAEYTMIDVRSETEALIWALRMPVPAGCKRTIEIRGLEENVNSLPGPGMQVMEADLRDHLHMLRRL